MRINGKPVARAGDQLLDVDVGVAERGLGLDRGGGEGLGQRRGGMYDPHAAAAAPRDGLHHHRVAHLFGHVQRVVFGFKRTVAARDDRDAGAGHYPARRGLVAHVGYGLVRRPDEGEVGSPARLGEVRVLRQEAVPRVDGFGVGDFGGGDDARDVEVRLGAVRRADAERLVGVADVEALGVGLAVYGDGFNAHLAAGADDADGDFAAVGYQYFIEQLELTFNRPTRA